MRRIPFRGELLGAARIRSRFAALPLDAFDRAGDVLAAEEQGAYFQLLRLAYGEGRNFCRAPKKDLQRRLGLSERRLHRVLDALVTKGFIRALHRDNGGTLWRVFLPRETFGEPIGEDVLLGRPTTAPLAVNSAPSPAPVFRLPAAPKARCPTFLASDLARRLASARGDPDAIGAAREEVDALIEDGASPRQIAACIDAIAERRAREDAPGARGVGS